MRMSVLLTFYIVPRTRGRKLREVTDEDVCFADVLHSSPNKGTKTLTSCGLLACGVFVLHSSPNKGTKTLIEFLWVFRLFL